MQQYGATDFVTIQPYLQQLPRDYPTRVLSHALAFRLFRKEGKLLAYEEGLNAVRIQHIGIPDYKPYPLPCCLFYPPFDPSSADSSCLPKGKPVRSIPSIPRSAAAPLFSCQKDPGS
jgi:hypothetical protein